jgi:hypothetical protein
MLHPAMVRTASAWIKTTFSTDAVHFSATTLAAKAVNE